MKVLGVFFAVTILTTSVAVTSVSLDMLSTGNDKPIVPKTVFSSNMRMVLAVGVEGTGHDFVLQVNDHMFDTNDQLVQLPVGDIVRPGLYHIYNSMGAGVRHYSLARDKAREQMRILAERGAELPFPGTMALMHGKYSYPDGFGPNKVLMYLDLRMLVEVAEEEGVDFRVLYLRRSAKDMLIANTVHRGFQHSLGDMDTTTPEQRYMEYMQIMLTDIAVVHSFLAELDPAFVVCHDFNRVGDVEQASKVAEFIAPNAEVSEPLKSSFVAVAKGHGASTESLPYDGADDVDRPPSDMSSPEGLVLFERAKEALSSYKAVGIVEHFALSMGLFNAVVVSPVRNWTADIASNTGKQPNVRQELLMWAHSDIDLLRFLAPDMMLYEHAVSVFRQQTAAALGTEW